MVVLNKSAGMSGHARSQHIGNHAGHGGGAKHVIHPAQPFAEQQEVHIVKEVVNVLHPHFKICKTQLVGQNHRLVELARNLLSLNHSSVYPETNTLPRFRGVAKATSTDRR